MNKWLLKNKNYFKDKNFILSFILSFIILIISLVANYYAGNFASKNASNFVNDIILSNIKPHDVDTLFIYGPVLLWIIVAILLVCNPEKAPFTLKAIAIFTLIRSIFVCLTHLGPFPSQIDLDSPNLLSSFMVGNDLFFSGHTGLPFLLTLIFWHDLKLRIFFFLSSLFFGAIVLMGHLHYSIDVLGAFFITYSIFNIAVFYYKQDRKLFLEKIKT